jgi:hypothetical protein
MAYAQVRLLPTVAVGNLNGGLFVANLEATVPDPIQTDQITQLQHLIRNFTVDGIGHVYVVGSGFQRNNDNTFKINTAKTLLVGNVAQQILNRMQVQFNMTNANNATDRTLAGPTDSNSTTTSFVLNTIAPAGFNRTSGITLTNISIDATAFKIFGRIPDMGFELLVEPSEGEPFSGLLAMTPSFKLTDDSISLFTDFVQIHVPDPNSLRLAFFTGANKFKFYTVAGPSLLSSILSSTPLLSFDFGDDNLNKTATPLDDGTYSTESDRIVGLDISMFSNESIILSTLDVDLEHVSSHIPAFASNVSVYFLELSATLYNSSNNKPMADVLLPSTTLRFAAVTDKESSNDIDHRIVASVAIGDGQAEEWRQGIASLRTGGHVGVWTTGSLQSSETMSTNYSNSGYSLLGVERNTWPNHFSNVYHILGVFEVGTLAVDTGTWYSSYPSAEATEANVKDDNDSNAAAASPKGISIADIQIIGGENEGDPIDIPCIFNRVCMDSIPDSAKNAKYYALSLVNVSIPSVMSVIPNWLTVSIDIPEIDFMIDCCVLNPIMSLTILPTMVQQVQSATYLSVQIRVGLHSIEVLQNIVNVWWNTIDLPFTFRGSRSDDSEFTLLSSLLSEVQYKMNVRAPSGSESDTVGVEWPLWYLPIVRENSWTIQNSTSNSVTFHIDPPTFSFNWAPDNSLTLKNLAANLIFHGVPVARIEPSFQNRSLTFYPGNGNRVLLDATLHGTDSDGIIGDGIINCTTHIGQLDGRKCFVSRLIEALMAYNQSSVDIRIEFESILSRTQVS